MTSLTGTIDGKQITIEDNGMVRFGGDDRINVLFYKNGKCIDEAASRAAGRPV
jgi:hypothetical protein